jgi:hypothetical protein
MFPNTKTWTSILCLDKSVVNTTVEVKIKLGEVSEYQPAWEGKEQQLGQISAS